MFDINTKIWSAIETLQKYCPVEGYFLAFSGGKDSVTCKHLLELSGCKYESHYSVTSVDVPGLKKWIKSNFPDVIFDYPKLSMFQLIAKKGILPSRLTRYCCEHLKEYSGYGRFVVTGVRNAESTSRHRRRLLELDNRVKHTSGKCYVNPIVSWSSADVFKFINIYHLYIADYYADCSIARGGCVGCPMAGSKKQIHEFKLWPKYKLAYLKAIRKAIDNGKFRQFEDENQVMSYWLSGLSVKNYFLSLNQQTIKF